MASIPIAEVRRLLVAERVEYDATNCPIRFEVWREYALHGPQARPQLLLERATRTASRPVREGHHDTDASAIAGEVDRRLSLLSRLPHDPARSTSEATVVISPPTPGSTSPPEPRQYEPSAQFGEWLVVRVDLAELLAAILPLTDWAATLEAGLGMTSQELQAAITPPTVTGDGSAVSQSGDGEASSPRLAWLFRVISRAWGGWDPDLDGERVPAADEILGRFNELVQAAAAGSDASSWAGTLASVNLDRPVTTAISYSSRTVKADVARNTFDVDCSALTWAVIDSGIDARHNAFLKLGLPGFRTRVTRTLDFNRIGLDAFQNPGRGDFVLELERHTELLGPTSASDPLYQAPSDNHGTHVAGILAGDWSTDQDQSRRAIRGICPDLNLWDLRVVGASGDGLESKLLMALQYVREKNARSGDSLAVVGVNISLSVPYNPQAYACGWTPVCQEVRRLVRSGVVVVVAAGNTGFGDFGSPTSTAGTGYHTIGITDPGNTAEAITVGATHRFQPDRYGASYFSSKGPTADGRLKPDLVAPGEGIFSAVGRTGFAAKDGTSQAAPHVSGAAALLIARNPELEGSPERLKSILCTSATDIGRDPNFTGHGLLDIFRAMQAV